MARLAVVMYRCDGCKATGEPEPYPEQSKVPMRFRKDRLPEDWIDLIGRSNSGEILNLQFCPPCVSEAARLLNGMALNEDGVNQIIDDTEKKEDK